MAEKDAAAGPSAGREVYFRNKQETENTQPR